MFLFIVLCLLGKADLIENNHILNFSDTDYYIHVKAEGIEIRTSSASSNDNNLVGRYTNTTTGKINLSLGALLDPVYKSALVYYVNVRNPVNYSIDITIENLNESVPFPLYVNYHYDGDYYTSFTFHVESPSFLNFEKIYRGADITVLSTTDDRMFTHISPRSQRTKYSICFNSTECSKRDDITIEQNDTYVSGIADDQLQTFLTTLMYNSAENAKFYFIDQTEIINLTKLPYSKIGNIELIGYSVGSTQKVHFENGTQTNVVKKWTIQNIQLSVPVNSIFNFNEFNIIDTEKVFPEKSTFYIKTASEKRTSKSPESSFLAVSHIELAIFEIDPAFATNGDVTISTKSDEFSVTSSSEEAIASIPILKTDETVIFVNKQVNTNNNKILIKAGDGNHSFNLRIEDSSPIPIQFVGFEEEKYSELVFDFLTANSQDISITREDTQKIQYHHYNLDRSILYSEYPYQSSKYVFCLSSNICEHQEHSSNDILQLAIPETDHTKIEETINNILRGLIDKDISYLYFYLKEEHENLKFNLKDVLPGDKLTRIGFINENPESKVININIDSFPNTQNNTWEINKCILKTTSDIKYTINLLNSIDSGNIEGENILITKINFLINTKLTEDQHIIISETNFEYSNNIIRLEDEITIKVTINEPSTTYKFIFEPKQGVVKTNNINVKFEGSDSNSQHISVFTSDKWNELSKENIGNIRISVINNEHICIKNIPERVHLSVYTSDSTPRVLCDIPVNNLQDQVSICYGSDDCSKQQTFSITADEIFISTKDKQEFKDLMNILHSTDKNYKYLKLTLIKQNDDYEIFFQDIPFDKIKELRLYGYSYPYVLLTDEIETENIPFLYINQVRFKQSNDITKIFKFQELAIDGGTLQIFPQISYNTNQYIKIDTARFYCHKTEQLTGLSYINLSNVNKAVYEITTDLSNSDYTIFYRAGSVYLGATNSYGGGCSGITSTSFIPNYYILVNEGSSNINHKIIIKRTNSINALFTGINLVNRDYDFTIPIEYECDSTEASKSFNYNYYIYKENDISIAHGTCTSCVDNITLIGNSSSPSESSQSVDLSETVESFETGQLTITSESSDFDKSPITSESSDSEQPPITNESSDLEQQPITVESSDSEQPPIPIKSSDEKEPGVSTQVPTYSPSPSRSPEPASETIPVKEIETDAEVFNLTSNGFIADKQETQILNASEPETMTKIAFESSQITINEQQSFSSTIPLYFMATKTNSTVVISKDVVNSNIGISTDNSPNVHLSKRDNPLSLLNNISTGGVLTVLLPDDEGESEEEPISRLNLNVVDNKKGDFLLRVPSKVTTVSFSNIIMALTSSFSIARQRNNDQGRKARLLDENEEKADLEVRNSLNLNPNSDTTIINLNLIGNMLIYDDVTLILNGKTSISQNSNIDLTIQKVKRTKPNSIIQIEQSFNSFPSKLTIKIPINESMIEIVKLPIIEARDFTSCSRWAKSINIDDPRKINFDTNCESIGNGMTRFSLSLNEQKEKKDNKLGSGAIAGIVVACILVVALIVAVVFILVYKRSKKGQKLESLSEDEGSEIP